MNCNNLHDIYKYGCSLSLPTGNNEFSFDQRKEKTIFVPAIEEGDLQSIEESEKFSFIEIAENGMECSCKGVRRFVRNKNKFIFDNHNHCYFFYKAFLKEQGLDRLNFVHIDQHKDMRRPSKTLEEYSFAINDLKEEFLSIGVSADQYESLRSLNMFLEVAPWFLYTNKILNVGNFIVPLVEEKKIGSLYIVDSQYTMENLPPELGSYVVDLDLDFFAEDMSYIDHKEKLNFVKKLIDGALAVFVATSPYFAAFDKCKEVLMELDL